MNPLDNPYTPGAGTKPPELAGRDQELEDFRILLARVGAGRHGRSMLISGLRGVGKTVLLVEFERLAEEAGWFPAFREVPTQDPNFRASIGEMCRKVLHSMSRSERFKAGATEALRVLKSFGLKAKVKDQAGMEWSIGIDPIPGKADSGNLTEDLSDVLAELGRVAKGHKTGVIFLFDEVQNLSESELSALITALHRSNQRSLPVTVLAAGLPQLPRLAAEAQSYSERLFRFVRIGALGKAAAKDALEVPAQRLSVAFDPKALEAVFVQSEGYPYFLQEWGEKTWNLAKGPTISASDVESATPIVIRALDEGFFAVRAERATPGERKVMQAMAYLGAGPYKSADLLKALGKKKYSDIGVPRDKLIKKGLIYSPSYGEIHFTVPQFDSYMRRTYPGFQPAPPKVKPRRRTIA